MVESYHVTQNSQSEVFISEWNSYSTPKYFYVIGSSLPLPEVKMYFLRLYMQSNQLNEVM